MKDTVRRFATVFGTCVITVSLVSGCSTGAPARLAMTTNDIKNFQPDCRNKEQQIRLLRTLRQASEEQHWDAMILIARPLSDMTNPEEYRQAKSLLSGEHRRSIDYNLYYLAKHCS